MKGASDTDPLESSELLTEIVRALVDAPESVAVEELGSNTGTVLFVVHTEPQDRGKVIGKNGRTVALLRSLFGRIAAIDGRRVVIEVADPDKRSPAKRKVAA